MRRSWAFVALTIVLTLLSGLVPTARAAPPFPYSPFGLVRINGELVPNGTQVTAWVNGVRYGTTTTVNDGWYTIDVLGDDPDEPGKDGGESGDTVIFKVGSHTANESGTWASNGDPRIDLNVTIAPTATPTSTPTPVTPTSTPSITPTPTDTHTPTPTLTPSVTPTPSHTPVAYWFNGFVYDNDTGVGIPGVTIKLYRQSGTEWVEINSKVTAESGLFGMWAAARAGRYALVEINREGYDSVRAEPPPGLDVEVPSADRIEFDNPPFGVVGPSKFYDVMLATPTTTPGGPLDTPTVTPTPTGTSAAPTATATETPLSQTVTPTPSGTPAPPTATPTPLPTSVLINPAGHVLLSAIGGKVQVLVPPGAVSEETVLTCSWVAVPSVLGLYPGSIAFILDAETLSGVPVSSLFAPIMIVVWYDVGDLPIGAPEDRLVLYRSDGDGEDWVALPSLVNPEARNLAAMSAKMGTFSVGTRLWLVDLPMLVK